MKIHLEVKHEKNCSRCNGGGNASSLGEGVNQAIRDFGDIEIVLYGDEAKIKNYCLQRTCIDCALEEKSIQMTS